MTGRYEALPGDPTRPEPAELQAWRNMLRGFTRDRTCSGLPIPHGHMKKYRDVLRQIEKQEARRA